MDQIIPIFPLNLVVYPDSLYPLHIFEERYKKLIARCKYYGEGFGIVAKPEEKTADIGCYVKVVKIYKKYPNGSLDILIKGINRFELLNSWTNSEGYLEASVLQFDDADSQVDSTELFDKTVNTFRNIIDKTSLSLENEFWDNLNSARKKSFKLAEKSGMSLSLQQKLLALKSENERLTLLYDHLKNLEMNLNRTDALRELIMNDGFVEKL